MAAAIKRQPYQYVDGLQEIHFRRTGGLAASFVFETAKKADKCRQAIIEAGRLARIRDGHDLPKSEIALDVDRAPNLTTIREELVLSYQPKDIGNAGQPIENIEKLIDLISRVISSSEDRMPWEVKLREAVEA